MSTPATFRLSLIQSLSRFKARSGRLMGSGSTFSRMTGPFTNGTRRSAGSERSARRQLAWRNLGPISVSPDGRWIASYDRPADLLQAVVISAVDGSESREIFRLSAGELDVIPMPWTPTSDAVIVRKYATPRTGPSSGGELWLIPLNGGAPRRLDVDLSAAVDGQLGKIRLSPDGRQLAYVVGKFIPDGNLGVREFPAAGCRCREVTAGRDATTTSPVSAAGSAQQRPSTRPGCAPGS